MILIVIISVNINDDNELGVFECGHGHYTIPPAISLSQPHSGHDAPLALQDRTCHLNLRVTLFYSPIHLLYLTYSRQ